jgi:hypothetical protein
MANALGGMDAPAAPQPMPAPQQQPNGGGPPQAGPQGGPQGGPPQGGGMPPAPTHEHAVATLRHFDAISHELLPILQNKNLGKSSVKSQIIDAATKLVGRRIMTPAQAVEQLGSVPNDPQLQRKWVENHYSQAVRGQDAILDHHRQAFPGSGDWGIESQMQGGSPDDHMATMSAVLGHYQGNRG